MDLESPPATSSPAPSFFGGSNGNFASIRKNDSAMDTENFGFEEDTKKRKHDIFSQKSSELEFREYQNKRRSRNWLSDSERMPKVRRVLSINPEIEKDCMTVSVLFVPIRPDVASIKTSFIVDRNAVNRVVLSKLSNKYGIPPGEIVLRHVDGDVFNQINDMSIAQALESSHVVAYQVPFLRTRVKQIQSFLKSIPSAYLKDFELFNSTIYHRPIRVWRMLNALKNPQDSKKAKHSREWVSRVMNVPSTLTGTFYNALEKIKGFVKGTCLMEQYTILVVAVQDMDRWKHVAIPQYVPYHAGKTTFGELRNRALGYVRRAIGRVPGFSSVQAQNVEFFHSGARCPLKGRLTAGVKSYPFPSDGSRIIMTRLAMIICNLS
uniref:Uncharacterized protein n=1 Tax=Lotharella oceanica TaxID=641309 RepID=A0A7S2TVB9_9EUKA|mmetsp:Transcript_31526/g.58807  ORF Transcript_31526/g.58807 Transcript_31526/m.58807 type:complete len:378 (+) Transcript_31526:112-1245(+)|eukprot:CAMPEP_0170178516 /NCGR_PEP_ID=MMETSP0040_2-20121228/11935_1 /TAXON_ID=641309 /ORGANISM="Lotharella oceanica, Strain CCMP622" /LENGTH=377 /DNA_ID=CAMNT_0010421601 /DNA_START=106 /DNA_END=1239 /DNA_ORIENTATION=-